MTSYMISFVEGALLGSGDKDSPTMDLQATAITAPEINVGHTI